MIEVMLMRIFFVTLFALNNLTNAYVYYSYRTSHSRILIVHSPLSVDAMISFLFRPILPSPGNNLTLISFCFNI